MSAENQVREASKQNSIAMNLMLNGDASKIASVWSHGPNVTALHPIGSREVGWDAVWASFEGFSKIATDGAFELSDQQISVSGDVAVETGTEHVKGKLGGHAYAMTPRVTNVYVKQDGGWKMIHHHSEFVPAILEVLGKLQPQTSS